MLKICRGRKYFVLNTLKEIFWWILAESTLNKKNTKQIQTRKMQKFYS